MSEQKQEDASKAKPVEKPSLFKRIIHKVDTAMKEKAEEKSKQGNCCGSGDGKGGKCC